MRERLDGGLDRGCIDERAHLNKGGVVLLSDREKRDEGSEDKDKEKNNAFYGLFLFMGS